MLRIADLRRETPTAATFANRRLQSLSRASNAPVKTARNDARATKFITRPTLWDICTLGHLPVLCVSAANEQGRPRGRRLPWRSPAWTGETVQVAYVGQGYI